MKRLGLTMSSTLLTLVLQAQDAARVSPFIGENSAFDTLSERYDRTDTSVDTTVVINDSLWMAVISISDADSTRDSSGHWTLSGGVCSYYFLMTFDPRLGWVKDYREIYPACDVEQSNLTAIYFDHHVLNSNSVEVLSLKAHYPDDSDEWDELVPFESHLFEVMPTGVIADLGNGLIARPAPGNVR